MSQLTVVLASLLTLATVVWALDPYQWENLYYRDVVMPRVQESHGFRWGAVTLGCRGITARTFHGVTSVLPDGRLSELGIRSGDVPFTRHGHGYAALHHALRAADQRHFSDVDVLNAQDCSEGKEGFRTVALHPQTRERPAPLVAGILLPSPIGSQAIEVTRSVREEDSHGVWLIDLEMKRVEGDADFLSGVRLARNHANAFTQLALCFGRRFHCDSI